MIILKIRLLKDSTTTIPASWEQLSIFPASKLAEDLPCIQTTQEKGHHHQQFNILLFHTMQLTSKPFTGSVKKVIL